MINTSHGKSVGKYHMVIRVKFCLTIVVLDIHSIHHSVFASDFLSFLIVSIVSDVVKKFDYKVVLQLIR